MKTTTNEKDMLAPAARQEVLSSARRAVEDLENAAREARAELQQAEAAANDARKVIELPGKICRVATWAASSAVHELDRANSWIVDLAVRR
jgi:hypothetical protein